MSGITLPPLHSRRTLTFSFLKAAEWTPNGVIEGRGRLKHHKNRAEIERLLHTPRASAYETATQTDPLAVSHSHRAQRSLDIQHYQTHTASWTEPVSRKRAPAPLNPQERKDKDTTVPLKKRNHSGYRIDKPRPKSTELRPSPPILLPALPTAPPPPTPTTAAVAPPNPTPLTALPVAAPQEEKLSREQDDAIQNDAPLPDQGGGTESTRYHEGQVKSSSYSPHKYKIAL